MTPTLTFQCPADLDSLDALCDATTQGEWIVESVDPDGRWRDYWSGPCVFRGEDLIADLDRLDDGSPQDAADAALIAIAPRAIRALSAALRAAWAENERLRTIEQARDPLPHVMPQTIIDGTTPEDRGALVMCGGCGMVRDHVHPPHLWEQECATRLRSVIDQALGVPDPPWVTALRGGTP